MISAQNLPLPLSGSNLLLALGIAGGLSLLVTCTLLSPPQAPEPQTTQGSDQEDTSQVQIAPDTTQQLPDTIVQYDTVWLKDVYDIALILPFHLDSLQPSNYSKDIFPPSLLALRFYTGVRMALDDLEKKGLNMRLHVFDSDKTSGQMKDVLDRPEMKEMDYIVGPLYPFYLRYSAEFGNQHQIPVVSPLSADTSVTHRNSYYMMVNPSIRAHAQRLVHHLVDSSEFNNLLIIHDQEGKMKDEEKSFLRYFYRTYDRLQDTGQSTPRLDTVISSQPTDSIIQLQLDTTDTNVVFIPSLRQDYVYYAFSQLDRIRDSLNVKRIYGPPSWLNFQSIDFTYFNHLNVHTTSNYKLDYTDPSVKKFRDQYINRYHRLPSRFAYKGYDVFAFVGKICLHYGKYFQHSTDSISYDGYGNRFQLRSVKVRDTIERYENPNVRLFEFEDFQIKEVKPKN